MCGVFGIVGAGGRDVRQDIFDALTVLQHRGQDAAGMATTSPAGQLHVRRAGGLVRDAIRTRHMLRLTGNAGIGHVRYPTAGAKSGANAPNNAQPFVVSSPYGLALSHNGNLTNAAELGAEVRRVDRRHLFTSSDSEVLLAVLAHEMAEEKGDAPSELFGAVSRVMRRAKGAYAVCALVAGRGLLAFRDPHGIRPLCFGSRKTSSGAVEYALASESVALSALGFALLGDLAPGEALFLPLSGGEIHRQQCAKSAGLHPCLFEYVYLSRPDSVIDGASVFGTRLRMGIALANNIKANFPGVAKHTDVVIPIPDSGRNAALELSRALKKPYREGFIKNRYIGRTFIMAGQAVRQKSVRQKLSPAPSEFLGKNVLLVDDSIVRGTTSKQIVEMARDAGAKKVFFASAAPPVRFSNVYGIDLPTRRELIASGAAPKDIAGIIGADEVVFQDIQDLRQAVQDENPELSVFEESCFTGEYPTPEVTEERLAQLEAQRAAAAAAAAQQPEEAAASSPLTLL